MKSIYEYITRFGKSRGFGIQSPWAYNFVRDVIMETLPYYYYEEIDSMFKGRKERKKQKLFFRVRNFVHNNFSIINLTDHSIEDIKNAASSFDTDGCIIIEDIYINDRNRSNWIALKNSDFIGITFDFYDFAICFKPNDLFKQHYKLNF